MNIQETIFQIDSKLKEISISEEPSSSKSTNSNVNSNVNSFLENSFEGRNNSNGILPNLSIKCFNGNPIEFQSFFWFISSSHTWKGLFQKYYEIQLLGTFLRWPAITSIPGLSLTFENYNQAIEIVEKRYGNKQPIITSHTDQLFSIAPITSTNDIKKIRETYDKIQTNVRNLPSLDIEDNSQYGPALISIVMSKLSEDIKLQISRSMPISREWDVDEFYQPY